MDEDFASFSASQARKRAVASAEASVKDDGDQKSTENTKPEGGVRSTAQSWNDSRAIRAGFAVMGLMQAGWPAVEASIPAGVRSAVDVDIGGYLMWTCVVVAVLEALLCVLAGRSSVLRVLDLVSCVISASLHVSGFSAVSRGVSCVRLLRVVEFVSFTDETWSAAVSDLERKLSAIRRRSAGFRAQLDEAREAVRREGSGRERAEAELRRTRQRAQELEFALTIAAEQEATRSEEARGLLLRAAGGKQTVRLEDAFAAAGIDPDIALTEETSEERPPASVRSSGSGRKSAGSSTNTSRSKLRILPDGKVAVRRET